MATPQVVYAHTVKALLSRVFERRRLLTPAIRAELISDALPAGVPLYVTGHSLGGAFATITAASILRDSAFTRGSSSILAGTYTFGAPRVGDADFSDDLATRGDAAHAGLYRYVDDKDPVPSVLVSWPWSHPGHKLASVFSPTTSMAGIGCCFAAPIPDCPSCCTCRSTSRCRSDSMPLPD